MIIMQNFQIAGISRQAFDTALVGKPTWFVEFFHEQLHHGEIRGYDEEPEWFNVMVKSQRIEKIRSQATYRSRHETA